MNLIWCDEWSFLRFPEAHRFPLSSLYHSVCQQSVIKLLMNPQNRMLFRERDGKNTFITRKVSIHSPYLHDRLTFACLSGLPGIERIVVTMCDSRRCCTSTIYRPCSASRRALDKLLYSTGTFKSYSFSTKCVDNRGRGFRKGKFNSGELWFDLASVIDEQTCNNYEVILNLI